MDQLFLEADRKCENICGASCESQHCKVMMDVKVKPKLSHKKQYFEYLET